MPSAPVESSCDLESQRSFACSRQEKFPSVEVTHAVHADAKPTERHRLLHSAAQVPGCLFHNAEPKDKLTCQPEPRTRSHQSINNLHALRFHKRRKSAGRSFSGAEVTHGFTRRFFSSSKRPSACACRVLRPPLANPRRFDHAPVARPQS
jgi:hypothetical protein